MRVLIVDDEIHVANLLADSVKLDGHEVTVASDGEEALALLGALPPDVVFLDVRLGELGGIEVLRKIRQLQQDLPVILITGHASAEEVEDARRLGVTEIIHKPFLLANLTRVLTDLAPHN